MLYTQHCCLYPMLNNTLRDHGDPGELSAFLPYLKLLLTALNKLPLVRAKVYRGVKGDLHKEYSQLQDEVFRWWAFSSTSIRQTKADCFMGDGDQTLFAIDAIGVDIGAFSAYPDEGEVLLLPAAPSTLTILTGTLATPAAMRPALLDRPHHKPARDEGRRVLARGAEGRAQ